MPAKAGISSRISAARDPSFRWADGMGMTIGRLAGIARHAFSKAPMEVLDRVAVTLDGGIAGDFRGAIKPGGKGRRQVTLFERADWNRAMALLGHNVPWQERRANLLVEGIDLPQQLGAIIAIGATVRLRVTVECDPCSRMDAIVPGLKAALMPDWAGGVCTRVEAGGEIAVGDAIRIEEPWSSHSERSTISATLPASGSSSARI